VSGLGVTAGAHRLWSHRSYQATLTMQALLVVMYSIADQGPIGGWALTHTLHHRASDTDQDPHNRTAGFWHAHLGWLFSTRRFMLTDEEYDRVVQALGPFVNLHDRVFMVWDSLCSLLMPALVASQWGDGINGLFVAGALRWAFVQHITFFVNSVAHGECEAGEARSFNFGAQGIGPRVSLLTTILALGEGWHDYHHLFPWDYAAAELDAWDQWNPTKVFIDACAAQGLAFGLRRCSPRLQEAYRMRLMRVAGALPQDAAAAKGEGAVHFAIAGPPFLRYRAPSSLPAAPAPAAPQHSQMPQHCDTLGPRCTSSPPFPAPLSPPTSSPPSPPPSPSPSAKVAL